MYISVIIKSHLFFSLYWRALNSDCKWTLNESNIAQIAPLQANAAVEKKNRKRNTQVEYRRLKKATVTEYLHYVTSHVCEEVAGRVLAGLEGGSVAFCDITRGGEQRVLSHTFQKVEQTQKRSERGGGGADSSFLGSSSTSRCSISFLEKHP